jgi:hypothetical protein
MGITMAKRKLMFLLGTVCILLIVVGYVNLNWGQGVANITPENIAPDNSTAGDNPEETPENNTNTNSTDNQPSEPNNPSNSTETPEENTSTNSTDNQPSEPNNPSNSTETPEENTSTNSTDNGNTETPTEDNTSTDNTTDDNTDTTNGSTDEPDNPSDDTNGDSSNTTKPETPQPNELDHEEDEDYTWDSSKVTTITLNTDSISVDNENGTRIAGTKLTITSAGTYSVSGTLEDGQIVVDTNDEETVKLILNGVNISSTTNAPVYVEDAQKTVIVLADNTENYLIDNENNENNGTLASRDDLTICGNGSLTVYGNANDAIRSNDGLIIKSGNITVTSVDDGIRGKNYLVIKGGNVTVNSVGDGLKSDNAEEEDRGYVSIEDGTIKVTSTKGDAITAQTDLLVTGGTITLTSGGGSNARLDENVSTKGLKAGVFIIIDDGDFSISSSDDAIHSNHKIFINDGTYQIASGDDGIHADTSIEINNGTVDISQSFEGIESTTITINNGYIEIVSSDDGIQVGGGDFFGGGWGGGGGGGKFVPEDFIYINGGFIHVDSGGDGLDADGLIEINDGIVILNGPESGETDMMDAAIDYGFDGSLKVTGGILVAAGTSAMAEAPSESSTQYSVLVKFNSEQSANTLVNIQTASGETVLTYKPPMAYQAILFSSAELATGSYKVYLGGTSTGTISHGIYEDGTYTPGTQYTTFTISGMVTTVGGGGGMFWGR